jgi:isopenicillin N synthase-like dioxygenase
MVIIPAEIAIPVIDLAPLQSGSREAALKTGKEAFEAFREVGFAYIKNHGVPQELIDQSIEWVSRAYRKRMMKH